MTTLIRGNNLTKFLEAWRPLLDFLQEKEKNEVWDLRIRADLIREILWIVKYMVVGYL